MMWFRNLRIGGKFTVSFGALLVLVVALATTAVVGVLELRSSILNISGNCTPSIVDCAELRGGLNNLMILTYVHIQEDNEDSTKVIEGQLHALVDTIDIVAKHYESMLDDQAEKELFESFKRDYLRFRNVQDSVLDLSRTNLNAQATVKLKTDLKPIFASAIKSAGDCLSFNVQVTNKAGDEGGLLAKSILTILGLGSLFALGWVLFLKTILTRLVAGPLVRLVKVSQNIQSGDLRQNIEQESLDEIGELQNAFQGMSSQLSRSMGSIRKEAESLTAAATEMTTVASDMGRTSTAGLARAESLSESSVQMNSSLGTVAATTEQSSSNLERIAAAIEEMAASISEIARNAERSRVSTRQAVDTVAQSSQSISELSKASQEISKVVESIVEIAEQTKLLALNATIEAARAGEAGKGFAVVAGEVKELAKGTAEATEDIRRRIEAMQTSTELTIGQISAINQVIGEVDALVGGIAAGVEQQSATTREIAGNASEASRSIAEATRKVAQVARASNDVTRDAADLRGDSRNNNEAASRTSETAQALTRMAGSLMGQISHYKLP
jgi:methyl-accepting chemotaxis protein